MQDTTEQQANKERALEAIEAIYENGVFHPLADVNGALVNGQHVKLSVQPIEQVVDSLQLLQNVYAGLSDEEIDEIESIMLNRSNWFTRSPDDLFPDDFPDAS